MNVSGYRHNYEDFYENFINQMSINRERTITTKDADVAQKVAQESILFYYGQVRIGGPFKANSDKGESLELDRLCRRSPRDPQVFMTDVAGLGICHVEA